MRTNSIQITISIIYALLLAACSPNPAEKPSAEPKASVRETPMPPQPAERFITIQSEAADQISPGISEIKKPSLELISQRRSNDWINDDEWLKANGYIKPAFPYHIDGYTFEALPGSAEFPHEYRLLVVSDPQNIKTYYDFTQFIPRHEYEPYIRYIQFINHIIYISFAHKVYTHENPNTGFVIAMNLDGDILWRSPNHVCNSDNFVIVDDSLICGYGYTKEKDYIYTIDISTGKIANRYPINSKIHYLFRDENYIRILTYNSEFKYTIK